MHENFYKIYRTRAENFLERLGGSFYHDMVPLRAECGISLLPVPWARRGELDYVPIGEGDKWGDKWESAWFRLAVKVPRRFAGKELCLLLNLGGESLIFDDKGVPLYGLTGGTVYSSSFYKNRYLLPRPGRSGEVLRFEAEAAANVLTGVLLPGADELNTSHPYGVYNAVTREMRLAVFDRAVWNLALDFEIALGLLNSFGRQDYRSKQLLAAMNAAIEVYLEDSANAAAARTVLAPELARPACDSALTVHAIGHAHIDVGWLWPVRESRRKAARTFASALEIMRKYPHYKFGASQAVLYNFIKQDYPELFAKIKQAVKTGRWEVQGGMWVEADANIISGESMIRQFLHGKNFFMDNFGVDVKNLWLPDVFGYSASMPQIIKKSGCDFFLTQKISWSQINRFPHHTFNWVGVDGSSVLTHFPPEDTYNSLLEAEKMCKGQNAFQESHLIDRFMSLFGIGDGGGGPTEEMVERGQRMHNLEGCPKVTFERADKFFEAIAPSRGKLETWRGELYLELHRATLTTQSRTKRNNRRCEQMLTALEFLVSALPEAKRPLTELELMWKTVLTNQFHDIIPGSSIREVYEVAEIESAAVLKKCGELAADAAAELFPPAAWSVMLVNTLPCGGRFEVRLPESWGACAAVADDGTEIPTQVEGKLAVAAVEIPAGGAVAIHRGRKIRKAVLRKSDELVLENDLVRYEFASDATLLRAFDKTANREILAAPGNVLSLYSDQPNNYDAWDSDIYYQQMRLAHASGVSARRVADGRVRQVLEFELAIGGSTLSQQVSLPVGERRLDFRTEVEWHEIHHLLRVAFPTTIAVNEAAFDIQYSYLKRPIHTNTSWDAARFEVCGQRYADLSEPNYGVALLNDCKYGHHVHDGILDLALLRSSKHPDFFADQGHHVFTYSLLPHPGDLVRSDVIEQAARLNRAPWCFADLGGSRSDLAPVEVISNSVALEVVKPAEKSSALVLRLVETRGVTARAALKFRDGGCKLCEADLIERATDKKINVHAGRAELDFSPFEIKTLLLSK